MAGLLLRRLLQIPLVLLLVLTLLFLLLRVSGDPVHLLMPDDATAEERERLRESLGLADPLWYQYGSFLLGVALRLDFGSSFRYEVPAIDVVVERLPATVLLASASILIAVVVGFTAAIFSISARGERFSAPITIFTLVGQSMPSFWLGIVLIWIFALALNLFPTFGSGSLLHLVLPAVTLSAPIMAKTLRLVRSGLLGVMTEDYIRAARAKGLGAGLILRRHAMKNMLIPVVTILGLDIGNVLGGAIVVETIFAWPGVGRLMVDAINSQDFPVVQAVVFVVTIIVSLTMIAVDIAYRLLDPRIR